METSAAQRMCSLRVPRARGLSVISIDSYIAALVRFSLTPQPQHAPAYKAKSLSRAVT